MKDKCIGIMGAMPQEIAGVADLLTDRREISLGRRSYYTGKINGTKAVVVFSRWGKVAAATTVSTLIHQFGISELFFTGVAGAIHRDLHIGDVVLGSRFVQHDLDARPLMDQFEIPLLSRKFLESDPARISMASVAINELITGRGLHALISESEREEFRITAPALHVGEIASGDQFFSSSRQKELLSGLLPEVLCVEMEGAAVAQVCYEHQLPYTIIRTISDVADEQSHVDFSSFMTKIAGKYAREIVSKLISAG